MKWSNGGRKHFKQTPNLLYNFFPLYHGDGICDGLAAIGKSALKRWEKDCSVVSLAQQLQEVLCGVHGFKVSGVHVPAFPSNRPCLATLKGCCKWYYKYLFPTTGQITAYKASPNLELKKVFCKLAEMFSFLWG